MFRTDGDVGRHVRVGRAILEEGRIPTRDYYSHTRPGAEWTPKEWVAQVVFAAADRWSGLAGTATVAALVFALAVGLTFGSTIRLGAALPAAAGITGLSLLLQIVHLLPRPHLFSTAFAALLMYLLIRYRQSARSRWVAAIPFLFLLWVNTHAGFPVGLALLTLFVADVWIGGRGPEIRRQRLALTATLTCAVLATLVNPVGPAVWSHLFEHLGNDYLMGLTEEFRSPDFHATWSRLLLLTIVGIGLFLGSGRIRLPGLGLALLIGTLAATLVSVRYIALLATLGLPWLVSGMRFGRRLDSSIRTYVNWPLRDLNQNVKRIRERTGWILPVAAILALVLAANGPLASRAEFSPRTFPVEMMSGAGSEQSGNIFNEMEWGGYLLYHHPEIAIFLDGHADFFGEQLVRDYMTVRQGYAGWADVLDRYGVDWTLTRRAAPVNQLLELSPEWEFVERDGVSALYRRIDERNRSRGRDFP
ncbi:MAG: hypothetical protein M8844_10680 [marine benthic group bacterium]|nr:hypothetical protein [Gemmatimonadota bacterium]